MLNYNEILPKKFIVLDGQPYEVLDAHIFRMQQRKPVNQTKIRNLISGKVTDYTFHQQDKVDEANLQKKEAKYLYNNREEWWFCEPDKPAKRFKLEIAQIGEGGKFLKTNAIVELLTFEEKVIGVRLPIKVELKVIEAPSAVKGDTSKGASKIIKLETGAEISAPLFINEGDLIRVNTETGEYVERVN
ncbi:MAG: Elongation factor P [Parcubacteria group bacterium GW2011_GWB1_44_7]|nr:MAG: Elongation factor P [Parcubacteria group bacterium GW2011_GWB1_44_7]